MMYSEYDVELSSLKCFSTNPSILDKYPTETAILLTQQIVLSLKSLNSSGFGSKSAAYINLTTKENERDKRDLHSVVAKPQSVTVKSEGEVKWVFEVLIYSVKTPLITNLEVIKHAINIYCNWILFAAFDEINNNNFDKDVYPDCIKTQPNEYICQILSIFCSFFKNFVDNYGDYFGNFNSTPQTSEARQEMNHIVKDLNNIIENILTCVEKIAKESTILTQTTWDHLIYFGLFVTNSLLVNPTESNNLIFHLADRISTTIFRIWLQACGKCFPRPSLWKTFHCLAKTWRHQEAFINHWNNINFSFTARVLALINKSYPKVPEVDDNTEQLIPEDLTESCINTCWIRFLHLIGSPVDICQPELAIPGDLIDTEIRRKISQPAMSSATTHLSSIFHRAMHGVSIIVDAFLGLECSLSGFSLANIISNVVINANQKSAVSGFPGDQSPPEIRKAPNALFNMRKGKAGSVMNRNPNPQNVDLNVRNSVAFMTTNSCMDTGTSELNIELVPEPHQERPLANNVLKIFGDWLFEASVVGVPQSSENLVITTRASKIEPRKFNAGRAEACGALCRIITHSNRTDIALHYLTKFYIGLFYGLETEPSLASSLVLSSIIFNTVDILRIGLQGVNILVPKLFRSIQFVLKHDMEKPDLISKNQLRRAAINHLFSLVSLPTHFISLDIKPLFPMTTTEKKDWSFVEVRKQINGVLSLNIRSEIDVKNIQMLIGCLMAYLENMYRDDLSSSESRKSRENTPGEKVELRSNQVLVYLPSPISDSASEIFNHALGLMSFQLVHKWKDDSTKQHAIEALTDMAALKFRNQDMNMYVRSVRSLCEFIEKQINKKHQEHSRHLHNIIISAYNCLSAWLVHHPDLLQDRDCMEAVLEICELGISGSKSKLTGTSAGVVIKSHKQLQPTSIRVKTVVEYLMQTIMSSVGAFPGPFGAETMSSLVKEDAILKWCCVEEETALSKDSNKSKGFRYYGVDNDMIMGLYEKPVSHNSPPSIIVVIRTSYGRYVWEMSSIHFPRQEKLTNQNSENSPMDSIDSMIGQEVRESVLSRNNKLFTSRPFNSGIYKARLQDEKGGCYENYHQHHHLSHQGSVVATSGRENGEENCDSDCEPSYFPDFQEYIEHFKVEQSIPKLESLIDDRELKSIENIITNNVNQVTKICNKTAQERTANSLVKSRSSPNQSKNKNHSTHIETARLLLYQLGYLSANSFLHSNSSSWLLGDDVRNNKLMMSTNGGIQGSTIQEMVGEVGQIPAPLGNSQHGNDLDNGIGSTAITPGQDNFDQKFMLGNDNEGDNEWGNDSIASQQIGTRSNGIMNSHRDAVIFSLDTESSSSGSSNFQDKLHQLDRTSARALNTCMVYYVKEGQKTCQEIWTNYMDWPNFNTDFLGLMLTLGWLVDVKGHPGWTGDIKSSFQGQWRNVSRSFNSKSSGTSPQTANCPGGSNGYSSNSGSSGPIPREIIRLLQCPSAPDGTSNLIYWSDPLTEIAFLLASNNNNNTVTNQNDSFNDTLGINGCDTGVSSPTTTTSTTNPSQSSVNSTKQASPSSQTASNIPCGCAVSLVWVDNWIDLENVNISELIGADQLSNENNRCAIIVSPVPNGLFRIKVHRPDMTSQPTARHFSAGPLHSGMLLDMNNCGVLIRQSLIHINRRIRHDTPHYASHLTRTQMIQHLISDHKIMGQVTMDTTASTQNSVKTSLVNHYPNLYTNLVNAAR